ncbi:hypothetical protein [Ruegeria marina]|nr:hypothetical protein [Ruegeria marina]
MFPALPNAAARPRLFIDAQHGLANRLRAIASAASVAMSAGYELVVIWRADHHCGCLMSDLFDYAGPVIGDDRLADLCRRHAARVFNYMEVEPGACFQEPILIDPGSARSGDVYIRSAYTLNSPRRRLDVEQGFLFDLKPSQPVLELVAEVPHPNSVSAHIRMATGPGYDHLAHEASDNWPEHRHREIAHWRAKSHSSRFIARIDALIEEGGVSSIFLAADLAETYTLFAGRYGSRLRTLPRALYDRSERQLQYALADMLLLTASDRFLASTWSSYSDIASRLIAGRVPVERSGIDF